MQKQRSFLNNQILLNDGTQNTEYVVLGEASSPRNEYHVPREWWYVVWVSSALGPYWGFQQGWMKWLSGVIDNALYPVLFLDYLKSAVPALGSGFPRVAAILGASALSNMGMFVAEMSSDSFQLLGMAERGMLPEFFGKRSCYGTPLAGIFFSASAFVKLRMEYPGAPRPYKIPVGIAGAILICIPPTLLILVVLAFASLKITVISIITVILGLALQPVMYAGKKRWFRFSENSDLADIISLISSLMHRECGFLLNSLCTRNTYSIQSFLNA
ncbi:hypothetical protein GH714_032950 [Hevea brasiliensis]|uniref:Amino acid permease/ SLC12A domain-containing protein n=1 Tax=Hevea brasiliensis TaxID=3981 RepID=A0A6A6LNQ6_HEVBR|nr:hypothetical protein GH714_032950 [Hevea brasiliensis]